ncbi:hypothetical protein E7T09_14415 [Deinococcus sp. KSM4-11]|uniref:hypothetical protein n=1 Tax=Deinococcus sp. KSM4-11 TaxID=2568654 RepID=UPI0010A54B69|nr:hypothetical protein [Deinococcus sp. KSM4-11]THF85732.1 hypothetical protein E7T09_14415 [Deinococcus sp. KSM4-11]
MPRLMPLLLTLTLAPATLAAAAPAPADVHLGGAAFAGLAADSYRRANLDGTFTTWLNEAYTRTGKPLGDGKTLTAALEARRAELHAASGAQRDKLALETATWAHAFVKASIPRFSLERGYEFASIPKYGERQCLLQSTIIAALLQRAGLDAGLVMVWKSLSGQESNLGHVTSVLRLSTGDVQIDASEPTPTATHQGLLAWVDGGWRFVTPTFDGDVMTAYVRTDGKGSVPAAKLGFLSLAYVKSQYDYYRAERTVGGVLGTGSGHSSPDGLKTSEALLRLSLKEEPGNPLAASVLGTVLRKEGRDDEARTQYRSAAALYSAAGHMPAGMAANLSWANGTGHRPLPALLATLLAHR